MVKDSSGHLFILRGHIIFELKGEFYDHPAVQNGDHSRCPGTTAVLAPCELLVQRVLAIEGYPSKRTVKSANFFLDRLEFVKACVGPRVKECYVDYCGRALRRVYLKGLWPYALQGGFLMDPIAGVSVCEGEIDMPIGSPIVRDSRLIE